MYFPISGVESPLWLPPLVAVCIAFFTSMGGVSGAFLLLPFQVSVLGYATPSVSATNHVYNIVAIRIAFLPDPRHFKFFVGWVLLYIGIRLLRDLMQKNKSKTVQPSKTSDAQHAISGMKFNLRRAAYTYQGTEYIFSPAGIVLLCLLVGIVGGIYGIGGGSIVAPFFVTILKLPVYTVAGAALLGTFITSLIAIGCFHAFDLCYGSLNLQPDWLLGFLFGIGGLAGTYLGARCQKFIPAWAIKGLLCGCVLFVAVRYLIGLFS